jgi:hypothetical protein
MVSVGVTTPASIDEVTLLLPSYFNPVVAAGQNHMNLMGNKIAGAAAG